jgi:hypothetical protein
MRYFVLETSFPLPHVRQELQSLEDAKEACKDHEVYTDEQMRQHAELEKSLERWDAGDRTLYLVDHGRYALSMVAEDGDIGEAVMYIGQDADQYRGLAATEPICALVAELIDTTADLQARIKALGIPDHPSEAMLPSGSWNRQMAKWGSGLKLTRQEHWDDVAANLGEAEAIKHLGPRPGSLEAV